MNRSFSRNGSIALLMLLIGVLVAVYILSRPQLSPGQAPLMDIRNIETLRMQFNQDVGQTRIIILVSPT